MTCSCCGHQILRNPLTNHGTAFTDKERSEKGLRGLLPARIETLQEQSDRAIKLLRSFPLPLQRYVFLDTLHNTNETLFYKVVIDHIEEIMPIIYTPTVGEACQNYSKILLQPRGLFVTINDKGHVAELLENVDQDDVEVIVVTDGQRILGLGDQGVNGMGIPVGKLALYTACAGVAPEKTLPVTIDVGTNNPEYLADPGYLGLRHERVVGACYDELVDEFMLAVRKRWPNALVQFEDFGNANAFRLLSRWKDKTLCFNDDIQGTACVAVTGFYSALRVTGGRLADQRILFLGAGEAATGIANLLAEAIMEETGCTIEQARERCYLFDSKGLVIAARNDLSAHKRAFAHEAEPASSFLQAIQQLRPTAIVGVAAQHNAFDSMIIGEMSAINERPIIFALSNPTSKAECTAEMAYQFSGGRALFASGSPFDPVTVGGKTFMPRQGNNAYVFPALGKAASFVKAKTMPSGMFLAASRELAKLVSEEDLEKGSLYPSLNDIRPISEAIAVAVAEYAYKHGIAQSERPADLAQAIKASMYFPQY
ncbi:MAG TPA: NAD-dependent malic enzyme [Candidatus Aphodousia gallistercoris]|nr:NAD-dependent malic enzyme [Candidatus Aphodousia gallistercoris]